MSFRVISATVETGGKNLIFVSSKVKLKKNLTSAVVASLFFFKGSLLGKIIFTKNYGHLIFTVPNFL